MIKQAIVFWGDEQNICKQMFQAWGLIKIIMWNVDGIDLRI